MAVRAMYEYGGFWSLYVLRPGLGMSKTALYAAAAGSGPQSQVLHHIVRRRHSLRSTDEMAQFINKLQTKNEQFYSPDIW